MTMVMTKAGASMKSSSLLRIVKWAFIARASIIPPAMRQEKRKMGQVSGYPAPPCPCMGLSDLTPSGRRLSCPHARRMGLSDLAPSGRRLSCLGDALFGGFFDFQGSDQVIQSYGLRRTGNGSQVLIAKNH